jgi:error-prone DNA polymerase
MEYRRAELRREKILSAEELRSRRDGEFVRTAGCVIARQRPGTGKGVHLFVDGGRNRHRERHRHA